jgi:hypothetical protein
MGAIVPVSAMNKMVMRGMNIILLMSMGVIAAGVVIVYTNKHAHAIGVHPNILTQIGAIAPVSTINRMVIRGLNIILLMSTRVIAVCIFAPVSALFRQPLNLKLG